MEEEQTIQLEKTPLARFEIRDAGSANWYLRKMRNLQTEKATIQAQTAAMLKAVDAQMERLRYLYEAQLQTWVQQELARRGGRSKTLALHQGTVAFRTVPETLRVLSAREAVEYARAQGWDVIKTVETLDAERYKREATAARVETGELLPGLEVVPERESFTIQFGAAQAGTDTPEEAG